VEADAIAIGRSSRWLKPKNPLRKILYGLANRYAKTAPVKVDGLLVDGQTVQVLGGLQVIDTAGHTPGHLSFFAPAAGILFSGDSIVSDEKGLHPSVRDNTWDNTKAIESVRKQAALGALIVCPGHGPVIKDALGRYPQV
jgi:glyoxylase-like metal-dependent hydrolase (beta-lactamase superfamily II)